MQSTEEGGDISEEEIRPRQRADANHVWPRRAEEGG